MVLGFTRGKGKGKKKVVDPPSEDEYEQDWQSSEEEEVPPLIPRSTRARAPAARGRGGRGATNARGSGEGSSGTQPTIPPIKGYESVQFATEAQRENFDILKDEVMRPSRWIDRASMRALGLDTVMAELFAGTGFTTLYGMQFHTYRTLTLEFLSSYELVASVRSTHVKFRALNKNYTLYMDDFGTRLGLIRAPLVFNEPDDFDPFLLWESMTGVRLKHFSNSRMSTIHHPVLRIWFKGIIGSFFGRPEVGVANRQDVCILGAHLNHQRLHPWKLDLAYKVADHLSNVAKRGIKMIYVGGIITCLLSSLGVSFAGLDPVDKKLKYVDLKHLKALNYYKCVNGRHLWNTIDETWITLPSVHLPEIEVLPEAEDDEDHDPSSYLIPVALHDAMEEDIPPPPEPSPSRRRRRTEPSSSSQPGPSYVPVHDVPPISLAPPPAYGQMLTHDMFASLTSQFHYLQRQNAHVAANNWLAGLPNLHDAVESNRFSGPLPTYYRGSTDPAGIFEETGINPNEFDSYYHNSFGGMGGQFLDQFGNLRVDDLDAYNAQRRRDQGGDEA